MTEHITTLAFAPSYNSPTAAHPNKRDATGAFLPEMSAFTDAAEATGHGRALEVAWAESFRGAHRRLAGHVNGVIGSAAPRSLECVAFFCHGFKHGLQSGHSYRARVGDRSVGALASALALALTPTGRVVLYACDAGRDDDADKADETKPGPGGKDGFASRLARKLEVLRPDWVGHIDAHSTAAHTTYNPYVRRFMAGDGTDEGRWIVEPASPGWPRWRDAVGVRSKASLRYDFPWMTREEVWAWLSSR